MAEPALNEIGPDKSLLLVDDDEPFLRRLAKAMDEIVPLRDPRVKTNPAYATVLILARVVTQLGALDSVTPRVIENLYAADLNYLYDLYRQINEISSAEDPKPPPKS